jgi:heme/copper-type cytochrome/quinol oxidase subunit 2
MKVNPLVYIALGVLILAGLFFVFKPQSPTTPQIGQPSEQTPEATTEASIIPQTNSNVFVLNIQNKQITSGPQTIKIKQGDEVTLKITSDEDEEFHIHGYDKSIDLKPGEQATLKFTANLSGAFPFELEKSKTEIGVLEVQPKL